MTVVDTNPLPPPGYYQMHANVAFASWFFFFPCVYSWTCFLRPALSGLSLIRHNAVVPWTLFPTGKFKSHFLLITCMILTNPRKANMPSPHSLLLIGLPPVQLLPFGPCWELCGNFACQFLYTLGEVIKVKRKFRNLIHTIPFFVGWAWEQARVISTHIYCKAPFLQIDTHWQAHTHMMRDLRIAVIHHLSFPLIN